MNIDKNIAAKLKQEMSKRGVNYAEFAEELGIPRTTMQGYVNGTSYPRADSMKEPANRLGISGSATNRVGFLSCDLQSFRFPFDISCGIMHSNRPMVEV